MTAALFRLGLTAVIVAVLLAAVWLAEGWETMRQALDMHDVLGTDDPELSATEPGVRHANCRCAPEPAPPVSVCDCVDCRRAARLARQMLAWQARSFLAEHAHIDMDDPAVEAELAELLRGGQR